MYAYEVALATVDGQIDQCSHKYVKWVWAGCIEAVEQHFRPFFVFQIKALAFRPIEESMDFTIGEER